MATCVAVGLTIGRNQIEDVRLELAQTRTQAKDELSTLQAERDRLSTQLTETQEQLAEVEGQLRAADPEPPEDTEEKPVEEVDADGPVRPPSQGLLEVDLMATDYRSCPIGRRNWVTESIVVSGRLYTDALLCSLNQYAVAWREYDLDAAYNSFSATVGIADESRMVGETIEFSVWNVDHGRDQEPLALIELGTSEVGELEANVEGVRRFRIVVEKTTHLAVNPTTAGSVAVWVNPRVTSNTSGD